MQALRIGFLASAAALLALPAAADPFSFSTGTPDGRIATLTRVNSPSDVAFDRRSTATSDLTFTTGTIAASFTANNSVINGINPKPNQTTTGEGAVTGAETQFSVDFTTPLDLPARPICRAGYATGTLIQTGCGSAPISWAAPRCQPSTPPSR